MPSIWTRSINLDINCICVVFLCFTYSLLTTVQFCRCYLCYSIKIVNYAVIHMCDNRFISLNGVKRIPNIHKQTNWKLKPKRHTAGCCTTCICFTKCDKWLDTRKYIVVSLSWLYFVCVCVLCWRVLGRCRAFFSNTLIKLRPTIVHSLVPQSWHGNCT